MNFTIQVKEFSYKIGKFRFLKFKWRNKSIFFYLDEEPDRLIDLTIGQLQ